MSSHKKVSDIEITGLNSVGISLGGISRRLNIHHTTVAGRLKALGISPADTRRSFMETIFESLSPDQQEWLLEEMSGGRSITDYVRTLLIKQYMDKRK